MTSSSMPVEKRHRPEEVIRMLFRKPMLRNIFITCFAVALLFPIYHWFYLTPAYRNIITMFSEEDAQRAATHLTRMLNVGDDPISGDDVTTDVKQAVS